MAKPMRTIADLTPDSRNANRGTERGRALLEKSIQENGIGRPILADRNGVIIAGNKTTEVAAELGITKIIEVESDGDALIVHKRRDLDLEHDDGRARQLAYADNRVGQVSLDWDVAQIVADQEAGLDLSGWWHEGEMNVLLERAGTDIIDAAAEWQGMPEYEHDDLRSFDQVIVHFANADDVMAFERLVGQKLPTKPRSIWYPKAEPLSYNGLGYVADDES